ncbi:MAG TPA: choice-of-anchor tandem repeat GloVer-containing protein [Candidatus Sulfotelmatobacter sp.]|nr:choice-of-anchor tandem repeat GloVer-containing protein [Candidatus Sulfotelmatobacter sp.]
MSGKSILVGRVVILLGVVLVLTVGISAQTESILHSFTNGSDGGYPEGGLVSDGKGNWYGTASGGGTYFSGLVFELTPNSSGGWTEQVIYNFTGNSNPSDGARPDGPLAFDAKGHLYGVTDGGGLSGAGTVFELSPASNGTWSEKILYSFQPGTGALPYGGGLALDAAGNLYGTGAGGGAYGYGGVYELSPGANGTWTEKVIYSFQGLNDGGSPIASTPLLDNAGNVYGVTSGWGVHDYGVVYELTPGSGGTWTQKVLYSFPGTGGIQPAGNLIFDSSGNLYGTTILTAYELIRGANGTWTEKTLHHFAGGKDGATALAGMVFDNAGNLYGTTQNGGAHRGVVYKLSLNSKGVWIEKILHQFAVNGIDGYYPQFTSLAVDSSGNVFGVTSSGGSANGGVVYEIKP